MHRRWHRDRMVVGFTTTYAISVHHHNSYEFESCSCRGVQLVSITTTVVSSNPVHAEVYSIQMYVIKIVSDLRQVGGFLRLLWCPPSIKLTVTI